MPKFITHRSLLIASVSPLPHSPSYLVKYPVNYLAGNRADYSPRYPVRNPAGYLDGYPASYWASYLPENLVSYSVGYPDSNSAGYPANCPDSSSESNPASNWGNNPPDYSESYWVDSLPDCLVSHLGSFEPKPLCREATGGPLRAPPEPSPKSANTSRARPVATLSP